MSQRSSGIRTPEEELVKTIPTISCGFSFAHATRDVTAAKALQKIAKRKKKNLESLPGLELSAGRWLRNKKHTSRSYRENQAICAKTRRSHRLSPNKAPTSFSNIRSIESRLISACLSSGYALWLAASILKPSSLVITTEDRCCSWRSSAPSILAGKNFIFIHLTIIMFIRFHFLIGLSCLYMYFVSEFAKN